MPSLVRLSSCGIYSTQRAFGTAAQSATCSSIRKCGQTATLKDSARWATFSQGVMPPMRRDVDLHDRAGAPLQVVAEMQVPSRGSRRRRRGSRSRADSRTWPSTVVGRQRLLQPAELSSRLVVAGAADRLVDGEGLVGVGEDLEAGADRLAHGADAGRHPRAPAGLTLTLAPQKPASWPASYRRPSPRRRGAASRPRSCRGGTAPAPRRRAHAAAGRRGGAFRSQSAVSIAASASEVMAPTEVACVEEQEVAPDLFDHAGLAADQRRRQRPLDRAT